MNDQDLRIDLLKMSAGDVNKAKAMYEWVREVPTAPPPPQVADGVVLLDCEILGSTATDLMAIAQMRLAQKQNAPAPNPPPAAAPTPDVVQP